MFGATKVKTAFQDSMLDMDQGIGILGLTSDPIHSSDRDAGKIFDPKPDPESTTSSNTLKITKLLYIYFVS